MFSLVWYTQVMFGFSNNAIYFILTCLDYDLYKAEQKDLKNLPKIKEELVKARAEEELFIVG